MATSKRKAPAERVPKEPTVQERPVDLQAAAAEMVLDRLRQNAMASRDPTFWERYQGACEMVACFGYTVSIMGERRHILTKTE